MFNVKNKIQKENAFVMIFESLFGYYYYDQNLELKFSSNFNDEKNSDINVMDYQIMSEGFKELFFCFDKTEDMVIIGIYVYELNNNSEIEDFIQIPISNFKFLTKLKKVRSHMMKKYGFPFFHSFFEIPDDLKLTNKEISFINCCYPDFITKCRESYLHNTLLCDIRIKSDYYIFPEHNFETIGIYVDEAFELGIVEDVHNKFCYMVLGKIKKNDFLKMKLSIDDNIMETIRNIKDKK